MIPKIIPVFKPPRMNSNHVVGYFKRNLPSDFGKIGHFGTLDPFASGVLMLGIAGGAKLNDYIHTYCPKTYLAVGKLGVHTETGDLTSPITMKDETLYLHSTISQFDKAFLQNEFEKKFLGEYWQAPHKYSAAKSQGRPMHEWARMGIEVVKEEKKRTIHHLEVVKYKFPYLVFRAEVSSGTYIRTLMSDLAHHLGTYGTLVSLTREKVGKVHLQNLIPRKHWPVKGMLDNQTWSYDQFSLNVDDVLSLVNLELNYDETTRYLNGQKLNWRWDLSSAENLFWVRDSLNVILGIGTKEDEKLKVVFNFERESASILTL
jgi:tRNA pseudouridine55 synthase